MTELDLKFDEKKALEAYEKAIDNIRTGNVLEFDSAEEAIEYLNSPISRSVKEIRGE